MRTNTYIIRRLQEACAKRDNARIDDVSYANRGTYGTSFLLYLCRLGVLPKAKIERDIMSATNAEKVVLDSNYSEHSLVASVTKPKNIPPLIYSDLSKKLPFTLYDTGFRVPIKPYEIPFKIDMIEIAHTSLDISLFFNGSTFTIEKSDEYDRRIEKISDRWENLLKDLGFKQESE
jgi:hypothetical protein